VTVAGNAPPSVTNTVTVSGGSETNTAKLRRSRRPWAPARTTTLALRTDRGARQQTGARARFQ
jgi:hypothetical protein